MSWINRLKAWWRRPSTKTSSNDNMSWLPHHTQLRVYNLCVPSSSTNETVVTKSSVDTQTVSEDSWFSDDVSWTSTDF